MTTEIKRQNSLSNYTIENYIQRVTELSQSAQKIPTNEELEIIATDLGISKEEIEIAHKQSQDHFVRSQGYFRLKHWDDAITELKEAVVFNPSNLEMLNLLANAHLGRWYDKPNQEDEQQIRFRIKQCLEIKPDHEESLNLLIKLDQALTHNQRRKIIIGALASIFIGSIIGYFFLNDISFNLFTKRDEKIDTLKVELTQEIKELKEIQKRLENQLIINNNQQNIQIRNNLEITRKLQLQINRLQEENQRLNEKINQLENQTKTQP